MLWEEKVATVSDMVMQVAENAMNFLKASNVEDVVSPVNIVIDQQRWEPPCGEDFKLNLASHCSGT